MATFTRSFAVAFLIITHWTKPATDRRSRLILRQTLESVNGTDILLDALDECLDREDLFKFIESLVVWNTQKLYLLAISRKENDSPTSPELLVICQLFIRNALVDAEIRAHILHRISTDT